MESISSSLLEFKTIWITLHALAGAIGLGAATVTDVMFFSFLKDGKINLWENKVFNLLTKIIWVALWIILATGMLIFLGDTESYSASAKFIIKMSVVGVLFLNGIFINKYLHPRMRKLDFTDMGSSQIKHIAFASGSISIVSWYIAFLLGMQKTLPVNIETGLIIYALVLVFVISTSQIFCNHFQLKITERKKEEIKIRKEAEAKEKKKKKATTEKRTATASKKAKTKKKPTPRKKTATKKTTKKS